LNGGEYLARHSRPLYPTHTNAYSLRRGHVLVLVL
jgi:hypothetical protein